MARSFEDMKTVVRNKFVRNITDSVDGLMDLHQNNVFIDDEGKYEIEDVVAEVLPDLGVVGEEVAKTIGFLDSGVED